MKKPRVPSPNLRAFIGYSPAHHIVGKVEGRPNHIPAGASDELFRQLFPEAAALAPSMCIDRLNPQKTAKTGREK